MGIQYEPGFTRSISCVFGGNEGSLSMVIRIFDGVGGRKCGLIDG
jgi:hypothetical protein